MKKAEDRIFDAIEKNQKILIWGDFDCDGVTSTTVLYKTLNELNASVVKFIPDRLLHGHGLNSKELVKLVSKERVKLVITVDCGISNISEINLLKGLGVDTIVSDHHTTDIELPKAYAIINPQVKGAIDENLSVEDIQSLTYNSGSIVAFKLAMALLENSDNSQLKDELLIIASCGAIADVVPLLGENRAMVTVALGLLNSKKENAQKNIYRLLSKNVQDRDITSIDIGFILAPRINAVGRLSNAELSFEFLNTKEDAKLEMIISQLDNYNTIRQSKCQETYEEIKNYLDKNKQELKNPAVILINPEWHVGIIGIVAAKIVENYNKPCFLMTVDENNNARCSIRSNDLINVYSVLKENEDLFLGFGGHKLAGGCSFALNEVPFEHVKENLLATISASIENDSLDDTLYTDIELKPDDITLDLLDTINQLEPFGQDNAPPLCAMFDVTLDEFKTIGKENNHLRLIFSKDDKKFQAVKWSETDLLLSQNSKCDIAFYPRLNVFNDVQSVQFELVDIYSPDIKKPSNDFKI
ncbi:single-stranded-DNA-specific exonuclease RecJ, partial [bacterium]|nr:single-stranded-DNA-specific exonuclease RecJ [bacterium]